jgi:hypothetical protein
MAKLNKVVELLNLLVQLLSFLIELWKLCGCC